MTEHMFDFKSSSTDSVENMDVIPETDRKERPSSLFWLWFASNLTIGDFAIKEEKDEVSKALRSLIKDYSGRNTALKISKFGIRYRMEVKDDFVNFAVTVSEPEFPKEAQEILSMILRNGGAMKGEIKKTFGDESEKILMELKHKKIITSEKYRNTEVYNVGKNFYRYFEVSKQIVDDMIKNRQVENPDK